MRNTLEGRFPYMETPVLYVIMQDERLLQDYDGFCTVQIPYHDNFPQILLDLRLSAVDAVLTDVEDELFIDILESMGIVIYSLNPMKDAKVVRRFGRKVWTKGGYKHGFVSETLKSCLDKLGAIVGCAIACILYVTVGPMIKLDSKGPILFKQERIGLNGRRFVCYKFRTMRQNADAQRDRIVQQATKKQLMFKDENDPRITKIGKFLRKTSLDEFPQFFNVLKGDMSIVGTRPPTVDEFVLYKPKHKKRLAVKPGVTGVWQTSGRNKITDFDEVVKMDESYIKHGSVFRYIELILKTLSVVKNGDGM